MKAIAIFALFAFCFNLPSCIESISDEKYEHLKNDVIFNVGFRCCSRFPNSEEELDKCLNLYLVNRFEQVYDLNENLNKILPTVFKERIQKAKDLQGCLNLARDEEFSTAIEEPLRNCVAQVDEE